MPSLALKPARQPQYVVQTLGLDAIHELGEHARIRLAALGLSRRDSALRFPVRLGAGLDEQGRLQREAMDTALACLERFEQIVAVERLPEQLVVEASLAADRTCSSRGRSRGRSSRASPLR